MGMGTGPTSVTPIPSAMLPAVLFLLISIDLPDVAPSGPAPSVGQSLVLLPLSDGPLVMAALP